MLEFPCEDLCISNNLVQQLLRHAYSDTVYLGMLIYTVLTTVSTGLVELCFVSSLVDPEHGGQTHKSFHQHASTLVSWVSSHIYTNVTAMCLDISIE